MDAARSKQLLDDRDDYLVVVGALHLVGKDSVIDLLEAQGPQGQAAVGRGISRATRDRR